MECHTPMDCSGTSKVYNLCQSHGSVWVLAADVGPVLDENRWWLCLLSDSLFHAFLGVVRLC